MNLQSIIEYPSYLVNAVHADILTFILALASLFFLVLALFAALWKKLRENDRLRYEFITIIAHKFRTPLTYVKWVSDTLVADEPDPFRKQSLQNIMVSNQKLIDLTGTLIELTDSDSGSKASYTFVRVSICEVVRGVASAFKDIFHEKNLFFSVKCVEEDIMVKIDRTRMEFVLQTLFENAHNYSPPGKNVEVTVSRSHNNTVITVADHGIGIARGDISHIFTKFFRTDNARRVDTEGFGIGLYLTEAIVRRHKGKLEVYSEGIDQGTTFTITLPTVK